MEPKAFQELAMELVRKSRPVAAELRTAISRGYYAAYHVGVRWFETLGFVIPQGPGGHGEVARRLQNSGDPDLELVGRQLQRCHRQRIQADYQLHDQDVETANTARLCILQTAQIVQSLDACLTDASRRSHVQQAIRAWERKILP